MLIKKIELNHFRNYKKERIELNPELNIFCGENAQGKTNILEAIFLCAFGKSFRTNKERELISFNEESLLVDIYYQKSDREGNIKIEISDKKVITINGVKIKKLSELLGTIPVVLFTPDDINILKDGPSKRRKFLDMLIGQLRPNYIYILNQYGKILEQRNNYLKNKKEIDDMMLDIWDEELSKYAEKISKYRLEFMNKIEKKICNIHNNITKEKEKIAIYYSSDCLNKEIYKNQLKKNRSIDKLKGFTTKGIHRDDFVVKINDTQVNIYGSQGQNRTAVLSLKLSELNVIYDEIGEYPILLLDDFMSELDEYRRTSFFKNIKETQVIITCTDYINIENMSYGLFLVKNGECRIRKE